MSPERRTELLEKQIEAAKNGHPDDFHRWRTETEVILRQTMGEASPHITNFKKVRYQPSIWTERTDFAPYQAAGVRSAVAVLEAAKLEVQIEAEAGTPTQTIEELTTASETKKNVFIVHGHNDARKHEVARLVRGLTGAEPVILHEQPDKGQVLIEKFEANAATAGFAVVLMTADDLGRVKTSDQDSPRARQNVVFELGYFYGALGRDRVAVLIDDGVEQVGDIVGVVYTKLDDAGGWKTQLARNMHAVGIEVDLGALISN